MVKGVFGLPGAGKTTFLTCCADHWLRNKSFLGITPKDYIFTNFYCQGCYKLNFDDLGVKYFHDCNILIDEIMLFADCRNYKTFSDSLTKLIALHRHCNLDMVWASQYWSDCDKKFRNVTDMYYLLERGRLFPFLSYAKPINRKMSFNQDKFVLASPLEWSIIYRRLYYNKFNSFEYEVLPEEPDLILWERDPFSLQSSDIIR